MIILITIPNNNNINNNDDDDNNDDDNNNNNVTKNININGKLKIATLPIRKKHLVLVVQWNANFCQIKSGCEHH